MYKKWSISHSKDDEIKYKEYKKIFEKLSKEAEVSYYKELFDTKCNTVKQLWKNLNKVCSFKQHKNNCSRVTIVLLSTIKNLLIQWTSARVLMLFIT